MHRWHAEIGCQHVDSATGILLDTADNVVNNFTATNATAGAIKFQANVATLTLGDNVTADIPNYPSAVTGVTGPADITVCNSGDVVADQAVTSPTTVRV